MGGDRTCPDNCLIAVWHSLPEDQRTKQRRRPIVETLAKQGYTESAIAIQLGVSHQTIGRDLNEFVHDGQTQPRASKRGRKNEGRPKGSTKKTGSTASGRRRIKDLTREVEQKVASAVLDHGKSLEDAAAEHGVGSVQQAKIAVAYERGRREAEPNVTPDMLSMTAQQKLDAAIRQAKHRLEVEIETRCREDLRRWLNEVTLPQYAKELGALERSIRERKGVMDRVTYRKILACLHPDRVHDPALKKRYEEAFRLFTELEKRVLDEKESPTQFRKMPRTYEELMAMKAKVQAERRAKRASKSNIVR